MGSLGIDPSTASLTPLDALSFGGSQSIGLSNLTAPPSGIETSGTYTQGAGAAASTRFSRSARFISKLQQLQAQDPAKFKQVLTDASNQLQAAAQNATGKEKQFLSDLADKFQKAANGDFSGFQPSQQSGGALQAAYGQNGQTPVQALGAPAPSQGHGHHHHHGGSSSAQQTVSSVFQQIESAIRRSANSGVGR